jgi:peptidoglycan/xylan/chitin deacetylase (PgdA/CDA1 family)
LQQTTANQINIQTLRFSIKLNIFLTYDYELYFGNQTGTAEKCILNPTEKLIEIANKTGIKMVFFIDTGYVKKLAEYSSKSDNLKQEYKLISDQIKKLADQGHDCQLHIHPHWEDCTHDGTKWIMNTSRYKLADFSEDEIEKMVLEYQKILQSITQKKVNIYRAGGWCIQPFSQLKKAFEKAGLVIDSSVFPGGKNTSGNYNYDFTSAPLKSNWKFSSDVCMEDVKGSFMEYPISSYNYSPLFFWRLFLLGRLDPKNHKPVGDGYPMPSPGMRKKMLTKGMLLSASADGYFVTKLESVLKQNHNKGFTEMVVLGHPKANTPYALKKLETFIRANKNKHQFITFSDLLNQ